MSKQHPYRIILSGGGTGGHIYPAIAIADELKSRFPNAKFLFVGAKDRMEMEKVPQAGYEIEGLWISGIQRKLTLRNLAFPFKLISSLWRSRQIIKAFKPDVAIGTGGFASGPLLQMATAKKVPSLIQEQNSFPGITNKLLGKKVDKICVAYEGLERFFPKEKLVLTGNPIRKDLLDLAEKTADAKDAFTLKPNKQILLVLGGSLGSRRINQLIENELVFLETNNIQMIWQCGKLYYEEYKKHNALEHVEVFPFLNRMDLAYAAADVIISRAGASSVSELCVVGKPVIFIPSPNVAEDHQSKNAMAIASKDAAIMIKESELDANFKAQFSEVIASSERRQHLSKNIKKLALANATNDIADVVEKLLGNHLPSSQTEETNRL
ncbi:undecaprenyldiphospho-muramoylpentapeptide beta-N-acetylglucosaminyltransferase [Subsaximicrobium wynnwilliamsii]|uniref:UDP-N-acetylglucosamine--N-acetylmuramyl-(pentapeptide) pyrophosphoryl-undecaprenol N-acetylglucosamine transferase n=1 Tax=Subsaximicrobium wynnwilliamsii TaxID=291179 RepID=A0A5C6ZGK8_9FLAO|nr:undecaprenyldiphospho-muramoylpentapeptide beta-N-acetylglucosaminyltransferase [Subsaximicrobium wynnwilliamsii]TXD83478.1 undecaprenyldiphospho-muramoylpentapeptide beta-N-acetylglucosaminyltransferase [Subsaximicrobium wynnwilliamsii]TXD89247.1 undecaprenyldiphospho-muramoylpentapeptide beta-N-acetylglucosaminyltransferase [Subsaximicrobium wynnwilliamsii]TXE03158.1 undecaprenyldiphospho-muramoylpentapeptide beta-N-acetylglucosaminyltransferase [Subsaximicrobium wynnwilliamsii]